MRGRFVSGVVMACIVGVWTGAALAEATEAQRAVLQGLARGTSAPWPEMTSQQAAELHQKAEKYLSEFQARHLPYGAAADIFWTDATRTAIIRYDTLGDSACWTGHYLAALAHKWTVTKDDKTLKDINAALDTFDRLTTVTGITGYVARYAGKADDPAYKPYYEAYKSGNFKGVEPWTEYVWLGNSSRDTYDGTRLGLTMAWLLVDDKATRERAAMLIERILDNLIANQWFIKDGKDHITHPTPTFQLAYEQLALRVNPKKYKDLESEYQALFERASLRPPRHIEINRKEYFAFNLDWTRWYCLARLEQDKKRSAFYNSTVSQMFQDAKNHVNAWFAVAYAGASGDAKNNDVRAIAQGQLLDFRNPPNAMIGIDFTQDATIEKTDEAHAKYALDIRMREPDTFTWQRSPTLLKGGTKGATYDWGGIDVFLPYWVGRAAGVIPAP